MIFGGLWVYFCLVKAVSKRRYGGKIPVEDILVLSFSMRKFRGVGINETYVFLDKFQQTHVTHTHIQQILRQPHNSRLRIVKHIFLRHSLVGTKQQDRSLLAQVSSFQSEGHCLVNSEQLRDWGLVINKNPSWIMTPTEEL